MSNQNSKIRSNSNPNGSFTENTKNFVEFSNKKYILKPLEININPNQRPNSCNKYCVSQFNNILFKRYDFPVR